MLKNNLGYPRIGIKRELKTACENYWYGKIKKSILFDVAFKLRKKHWKIQKKFKIDLIPCNDFSFYDHILDMSFLLGVIPKRYNILYYNKKLKPTIDLYFAMARGYQKKNLDITAMEMTKWFDTNYHYIVPEFYKNQKFYIFCKKIFNEFEEGKKILKIPPKPVLIGPVSYLLLGKEKEKKFNKIELIKKLVPIYIKILNKLYKQGASWIQIDEPFLSLDLNEEEKKAFQYTYFKINKFCKKIKILLTTYFEGLGENTDLVLNLPVNALHLDLVKDPYQLDNIIKKIPKKLILSLGLIDGRNIWKNNYTESIKTINKSISKLGKERIMISTSCSLLHVPFDINYENNISSKIKKYISFSYQKLEEINDLYKIIKGNKKLLNNNLNLLEEYKKSKFINNKHVKERVKKITKKDFKRKNSFYIRQKIQKKKFNFPIFPTTTIGSFPQTKKIRNIRYKFKKKKISLKNYEKKIKKFILNVIKKQEKIGLDVLVHGEFERNDMVEYFGENLKGFISTENGWVQSYGSRCVKPPILYGDVERKKDITVKWSNFAQKNTKKIVKGMLTGPITILQWSFVRNDQPRSITSKQIALAIQDEVKSLEKSGIKIIQIDEPAFREGLPLKKKKRKNYFDWAINSFKLTSSNIKNETQIHTHMCYSEFHDIIKYISKMDADVITIETSRSQMELLEIFSNFKYPNEIGPGIYDVHSPRIPSVKEMLNFLKKASSLLPIKNIWVNPDCGLKTRKWSETIISLKNMIKCAKQARKEIKKGIFLKKNLN